MKQDNITNAGIRKILEREAKPYQTASRGEMLGELRELLGEERVKVN